MIKKKVCCETCGSTNIIAKVYSVKETAMYSEATIYIKCNDCKATSNFVRGLDII